MITNAYVKTFYVVGSTYEDDEFFMSTTNYENGEIFETRELAEQSIKEDLEEFGEEFERTREDYNIAKIIMVVERDINNE